MPPSLALNPLGPSILAEGTGRLGLTMSVYQSRLAMQSVCLPTADALIQSYCELTYMPIKMPNIAVLQTAAA